MAETAKREGVCIAIDRTGPDQYRILYPKENQREMDSIKMTTALQKADPVLYAAICKQLDYENSRSVQMIKDALNYEGKIRQVLW